jgi:putative membrane protein
MTSSERRLHPLSLVFSLARSVRQLVIPALLALFAASRRDRDPTVWLALLFFPSAVSAVIHYVTFRYRYDADELVIRSGLFVKNERHIPYGRIQNIDAIQSLPHRILGLATVRIETGSGEKAEGEFSVLPIEALEEMRSRVFSRADRPAVDQPIIASAGPHETLVHLPPRELLLAGVIESRGLVAIAATFGFVSQLDWLRRRMESLVTDRVPWLADMVRTASASFGGDAFPWHGVFLAFAAFLASIAIARVFSAIWTVVRLFDFRVAKHGEDLRIEHGFLTRVVANIPLRRIQAVIVDEGVGHRLFGRVAVRVVTAGGKSGGEATADREWLAPILRRESLAALLSAVQPGLALDVSWHRAHPRGYRRAATVGVVIALVVSAVTAPFIHWWASLVFGALAVNALIRARLLVANMAWGTTDDSIVFRGGRLRRHTAAARFSRIQTVRSEESPFDRRSGMATVWVDTAGGEAHLEMGYLSRKDATELESLLSARAAGTAFVW